MRRTKTQNPQNSQKVFWIVVATLLASSAFAADSADSEPATAGVRRIVVSIPDRKLALIENDTVAGVFDVAVGAPESPSPVGTFTIVSRVTNPTYYHPGKVIAPGATNPIGTRWIGLSEKGFGIHGTDDPKSIGHARSHGCVRLRNADVEKLFERVRGGDVVELHAERTAEISALFPPSLAGDSSELRRTRRSAVGAKAGGAQ